jgi:hypothetical protein
MPGVLHACSSLHHPRSSFVALSCRDGRSSMCMRVSNYCMSLLMGHCVVCLRTTSQGVLVRFPTRLMGLKRDLAVMHCCPRIPFSTCHSQLAKWCGSKPRLLLLNRVDMISESDRAAWTRYFVQQKTPVLWTDGVSGLGSGQVGFLVGLFLGSATKRPREGSSSKGFKTLYSLM